MTPGRSIPVSPAKAGAPASPCGPACGCAAAGAVATRRLSELSPGEVGVICDAQMDASDAALLRAMGLSISARVRLCRQGEPCIVAVMSSGVPCQGGGGGGGSGELPCCSSRIGLARALATRILVSADTGAATGKPAGAG